MSTLVQQPAELVPAMSRQERVIFTVYVAMGAMIVAFLATTFALWSLGV
jgi:hypothetical protein